MATAYRYTGETPRDYPTLGCTVQPGDVIYLDGRAPDARFEPVADDTPAEQTEPQPESEQPKRKPGRPRKTDTTDDTAGE